MMDAIRCGNCAFWGRHPTDVMPREEQGKFRQCMAIVYAGYAGFDYENSEYSDLAAITVDASGVFAALRTKEDFGCRLFKAVEE